MSNNLYLFDPRQSRNEIPEKPLADIMRDADIARAEVAPGYSGAWYPGFLPSSRDGNRQITPARLPNRL